MHNPYNIDATLSEPLVLDVKSPSYKRDLEAAIKEALQDGRPELSEEQSDAEMKRFQEEEFPDSDITK